MNEVLKKAFETIRSEIGFDMLSNLPHPENLRFQMDEECKAMHRVGLQLRNIVFDPEGEDLQYAAHAIRQYFGDALGMEPMPEFLADVPRFLLPPDNRTVHRTNPQELARHLMRMTMPQVEIICITTTQLKRLQKLLHLSDAEVKFLTLAYVVSSPHLRTSCLSAGIVMALEHIGVKDDAHRHRAIGVLLDVPVDDVIKMLSPPCSLNALRFVDSVYTNREPTLRDSFVLTDEFVEVLETTYRSHEALLYAIVEPEQDLNLLNDEEVPVGHLYEVFQKDVAEAFECAVLCRPLKSYHINALVSWYSAGHRTLPSLYSPLAGRINVEGVRIAIQRAAFDCRIANVPLDTFALMRALYAAADIRKS